MRRVFWVSESEHLVKIGAVPNLQRQMPILPVERGGERRRGGGERNLETKEKARTQPQYGAHSDAARTPVNNKVGGGVGGVSLKNASNSPLWGCRDAKATLAGGVAVCLPISTCCAEYPPTCTAGTDRQIDISPSPTPAGPAKGGGQSLCSAGLCISGVL